MCPSNILVWAILGWRLKFDMWHCIVCYLLLSSGFGWNLIATTFSRTLQSCVLSKIRSETGQNRSMRVSPVNLILLKMLHRCMDLLILAVSSLRSLTEHAQMIFVSRSSLCIMLWPSSNNIPYTIGHVAKWCPKSAKKEAEASKVM